MIKAGYLLQITTWENDGDNYSTKSFSGLDYNECVFMAKVCELFASRYSNLKGFGNSDRRDSQVFNAYRELLSDFKKNYGELPLDFDEEEDDYISDILYDIVGTWCDGDYWRVVENYKVYYFNQDVSEVIL
jgi:hypothetical protein